MNVNDASDELASAQGDDEVDAIDDDAAALAEAERLARGPVPAASLSRPRWRS
jgi:hypothetical protein